MVILLVLLMKSLASLIILNRFSIYVFLSVSLSPFILIFIKDTKQSLLLPAAVNNVTIFSILCTSHPLLRQTSNDLIYKLSI